MHDLPVMFSQCLFLFIKTNRFRLKLLKEFCAISSFVHLWNYNGIPENLIKSSIYLLYIINYKNLVNIIHNYESEAVMERFIQECKKLIETYSEDCIVRKNGTILLSPGKIPNCKHMFHKGLEQEVIDEFLVSEYKNHFPEEYIEFLKFSNGATLYRVKIKTKKFEFGMERLILFGLPLTPPFSRPMDEEEPFDIRIEDLGRHKLISKKWLKFGCYTKELPV